MGLVAFAPCARGTLRKSSSYSVFFFVAVRVETDCVVSVRVRWRSDGKGRRQPAERVSRDSQRHRFRFCHPTIKTTAFGRVIGPPPIVERASLVTDFWRGRAQLYRHIPCPVRPTSG